MDPDSNNVEAVKMTVGLGVVIGILILLAANAIFRPKQSSLAKQRQPAAKDNPHPIPSVVTGVSVAAGHPAPPARPAPPG